MFTEDQLYQEESRKGGCAHALIGFLFRQRLFLDKGVIFFDHTFTL